ncbi:hypothetical protein E8E12_008457 [Didymella heteroderae]|uniref:Protein kinase domain-containing protein n=1 Tax=Didymella heteroderae TaxID=1769908 RepID=A0A9P5C2W3_9PLEO|nr:hypothetical protein E8E12_008457 [Didymella heteroderae]
MSRIDNSETKDTIHILHLSYDNDDRSALTILANDVRFQVIADPKDLQRSSDKTFYYEYLDKVYGLRDAEQREYDAAHKKELKSSSKKRNKSEDRDSAVDVTADEDGSDQDQDSLSAEHDLRKWLLTSMTGVIAEYAPAERAPEPPSLHDWYHGPTYFYSLGVKSGELIPEELEESDELNARIEKLSPRMKMPQYIQKIDVPWINANDMTVQSEVDFPEPAHPGKVTGKDGKVYFFKPVVNGEPGPIKREISILQKIEDLGLDIKVPRLVGFVAFENSETEAMGFLLSHIEEPMPLTKMLKSSVPEEKRDKWSKKSKEYVDTLHKHDIIWGDAKADNFMVDKHDDLWIIDFGGSYTEGWVDPALSDTLEGDEQGLQKVQEALQNPDEDDVPHRSSSRRSSTPNPSTTVHETASSLFVTEAPGRKRSHAEDVDEGVEENSSKRRRGELED